jgi:PAS domain S-box-containing protein
LSPNPEASWRESVVAAGVLVVLGLLVRWLLDPLLSERVVFVTMFPSVAAAAWFGGHRAGLLAMILGALGTAYLFIPPERSLAIGSTSSTISLVAFLTACSILLAIANALQRASLRSRESEFVLQSVLDGMPALVALTSRDLRYRLVNAEYTKWFGLDKSEIQGKPMEEVLGRETWLKIEPRLKAALAGETVSFREYLPYTRGGGKWVQVTYRPHYIESGRIDGVVVLVQNVTEQHLAEEALAQQQKDFRAMFELNATGSAMVDAATERFLLVNEKLCEVTGYTQQELLEKTFAEITHPEDRAHDLEVYRTVLQSRDKYWESEKRYQRKDGAVQWVLVRGTILRDESGAAVRILATITDLTEWKLQQQALENSERRLRLALDAGEFGTWEWVIRDNHVIWSDRLYAMHGIPREAFTGDVEQFQRLVHPEDWPRVYGSIQETLEKQAPYMLEFRAVRPDGEVRWFWTTATVIYQGREPSRMIGITADVTERKRMELQLRENEERMRLAQRAAKIGTWDWQLQDNKLAWSEGIFELLGLPAWQAQPTPEEWMAYVHPEDRKQLDSLIPELLERGGAFTTEFRVNRADGAMRWLLAIGHLEKDAQGKPVRMLGVNVDITERKKAEELLQSQAQHLEELVRARTERLQEVVLELESFSYTIAHDLRGPLRAMNGFASALLEEYAPRLDNTARDYLKRITGAAHRMDRLICDVLDYSKITRQNYQAEPVDLDPLIDGILETYPALQGEHGKIQVERPLPVVMGSAPLLVQCFSNLVGNAVKFVPAGRRPEVRVWSEPRENARVRLWVEDNGIGIPREDLPRIFGLFQRLDKTFEGTGIGLAIVSRAVERMGGTLGVESKPGEGSRFWLELPTAPARSAALPRMSAPLA